MTSVAAAARRRPSLVRPLRTAVDLAARRVLAERGGLVVTAGFYLLVVSVLAGLWRVAAAANGDDVTGYSAVALTWYIATTEAATVSLNIRLIEDIGSDISSGSIATELLRPASVLGLRVASEIGRALPRLAVCMIVGAALSYLTAGAPPHVGALALAVPALLVAVVCNLVMQHAFAAWAFWLRDAGSAWFLYQKLVFILGGMLLPLEVLPDWLRSITRVLPFRATAYIPARLASGHLEPMLVVEQLGWLALLVVVASALFRAGERRLQVVGG